MLFYHSVKDKSVIGEAEVVRESYRIRQPEEGDWISVDLKPIKALPAPGVSRGDQGRQEARRNDVVASLTSQRDAGFGAGVSARFWTWLKADFRWRCTGKRDEFIGMITYRRAGVASTFSPTFAAVLAEAGSFARHCGAELEIIHAAAFDAEKEKRSFEKMGTKRGNSLGQRRPAVASNHRRGAGL